ncbi:MAG: hypothetical protein IJ825_10855 [Oscillospiraceae bacterium]|nr:hypothetical protein [Oscillospiraceae bacterium]
MAMPASVDEKAYMKAYMSRKIRTFPFLILMLFSLLPLISFSFEWARGQLAWHKTVAEVVMTTDDGGAFYRYTNDKTGETYSGTLQQYKILIYYPVGHTPQVHDTISMAYKTTDPVQHVIFSRLEARMATWAAVFVFCFVIYFWLEWELKKRSKIKIAG